MVELLAPAGSRDALIAAVQAGANAVYLGGKAFGARQYASNFTDEELADVVKYAHLRNVKIYVTVNTLIDNQEIDQLIIYLKYLYEIGVDAIIVQDVGVAKIARQVVPDLHLHASTQMTVMNSEGVKFLAGIGFKRVVLAREVSLSDIKAICEECNVEIETFIHGALCVCYSGQCLMSSLIGGRSGNRGRCAQPCRLPYTLVNEKGEDVLAGNDVGDYLLSPRDLNTLDITHKMIEAGITSFKIEGRMKRPEYVAVVVDAYRRDIDAYYFDDNNNSAISEQDKKDIEQIFNRDFTTGYLLTKQGRYMMSDRRPNNRGVRIGRVVEYNHKNKTVTIKLDDSLFINDGLEFWVKVGGRVGVTVSSMMVNGKQVDFASKGSEVTIPLPSQVKVNDRVFKTYSAPLMDRAQSFFADKNRGQISVDAYVKVNISKPLEITLFDNEGNKGIGVTDFVAQEARNRPLTVETVTKQVNRLGTTDFILRAINCSIDEQVMVPISEINEARRMAVENLEKARLQNFKRPDASRVNLTLNDFLPISKKVDCPKRPELVVNVDSLDKLKVAIDSGADFVMFGGENYQHHMFQAEEYRQAVNDVRSANKKIILSTPRISHEHELKSLERDMELFAELEPDAIAISNLGALNIAQKYKIPLHGDYPLNIYNGVAVDFFSNRGVHSVTLSPELNMNQIVELVKYSNVALECIVHGRLTMMISEYCVLGCFLGELHKGKCLGACTKEKYYLKDRMSEYFPIITDQYCRMHILNAKELSMLAHINSFIDMGINRIRIEGKYGSLHSLGNIVKTYKSLLDNKAANEQITALEHRDITRGHYFRGVL